MLFINSASFQRYKGSVRGDRTLKMTALPSLSTLSVTPRVYIRAACSHTHTEGSVRSGRGVNSANSSYVTICSAAEEVGFEQLMVNNTVSMAHMMRTSCPHIEKQTASHAHAIQWNLQNSAPWLYLRTFNGGGCFFKNITISVEKRESCPKAQPKHLLPLNPPKLSVC